MNKFLRWVACAAAALTPLGGGLVFWQDSAAAGGPDLRTQVAAASAHPTYQVTDDVSARFGPTAAPTNVYGLPRGTSFRVDCQQLGEPTGPNGNRLHFRTYTVIQGRVLWVPDTFSSSPHLAGQPPIAGIAMCTAAVASAPAPAPANRAIWIGSPLEAAWPNSSDCPSAPDSANCSLPGWHHRPHGGDFALDIQPRAGQSIVNQQVVLYAAPQVNHAITAKIISVVPACASGRVGDGGYLVKVGFYDSQGAVGWAAFAHINPASGITAGAVVNRWGTVLGTVGAYSMSDQNRCWVGQHTHVEIYSERNYACYRGNLPPAAVLHRSNFIGYTGISAGLNIRTACP